VANLYLTQDEVEASLELTNTNYAELDIARAVEAASRAVDNRCGRRFWLDAATSTRFYTPVSSAYLKIDDVNDSPAPVVTWGGSTKVVDTDFFFISSSPNFGVSPYGAIRPAVGMLTTGVRAISVTAKFGWPTIPPEIKAATGIIAAQLLRRIREAPFGVLATSFDGAAIRIGRNDPQLDMLLSPYTRTAMIE
jgi:hypothetical protein